MFCSFHFFTINLCLTLPFKPCCERKNSSATRQEGRIRKVKRLITYIKVHLATRWTIRLGLMLLWFTDLMNVTEEVTQHFDTPV